ALTIHLNAPFHAGHGGIVFDIRKPTQLPHECANVVRRLFHGLDISAKQPKLDGLSLAGAHLLLVNNVLDAWNFGSARSYFIDDLRGAWPLVPFQKIELQNADRIGRNILAARIAATECARVDVLDSFRAEDRVS